MDNCASCKYQWGQGGAMFCRRYPPMPFIQQGNQASMYPPTQPSMWCGEYELGLVVAASAVSPFRVPTNG